MTHLNRGFDILLIPEISGAMTDLPIVEWIENVELVCELREIKRVERVRLLRLRAGALTVYRQLMKEQRSDAEQIKEALMTAYTMDPFNTFEQFTMQQLHPGETSDEFFAELKCLVLLVGGQLAEWWMAWAFVSGLPQVR